LHDVVRLYIHGDATITTGTRNNFTQLNLSSESRQE
jgi:hypothetical protein